MKFDLSTSGMFYSDKEQMEGLKELGFTFEPSRSFTKRDRGVDDYVISGEPTIEIETLEDLAKFAKKWGEVILWEDSIEIYDNYRE